MFRRLGGRQPRRSRIVLRGNERKLTGGAFGMGNETVTITKAEYERLLDAAEFLSCLEACGVDNWGL